ncbi:hypothetical protein HDA40_004680 [Hamadaea flava]|uniref:DUF5666 domain-containing protein n=1 Tax=Hamadaea flava TaxID=1742688 RepID=A0ABV8LEV9_9ACTN|nr:hypothetical protein [Hamadaea flava]MCP2326173.1 hypothetical protein [Hamadaea flava]
MRKVLVSMLLGAALLGGATACGPADVAGATGQAAAEFTPEGEALVALGFDPSEVAAAEPGFAAAAIAPSSIVAPSPSGKGDKGRLADSGKRRAVRVMLAKNTLHGEAVVQKKDGTTITVLVQKGVITELTADHVTVKSADGYTLTWALGDQLRVVEKRKSVQPSEVKVGQQIGVAGAKQQDDVVARFILIPAQK